MEGFPTDYFYIKSRNSGKVVDGSVYSLVAFTLHTYPSVSLS